VRFFDGSLFLRPTVSTRQWPEVAAVIEGHLEDVVASSSTRD